MQTTRLVTIVLALGLATGGVLFRGPSVRAEEQTASAKADELTDEQKRELQAQVELVRKAGFYALKDPQEKIAVEKLQRAGRHAAPIFAEMLKEGHKNRKYGWIEVYRPLYVLQGMGEHARVALPDVIKALDDEHQINVGQAVKVLESIGPPAKEAVPVLLKVKEKMSIGRPERRKVVDKAIRKIDPEAARKLGIE